MHWSYDTLEDLADLIWRNLHEGAAQAEHPFHVGALATRTEAGGAVRAMVLRRADAELRQLICSSDLRAAKVKQLQTCSGSEWMFYDARTNVQIRAGGTTAVHSGDALARAGWETTPRLIQAHYASPLPPGSPRPSSLARLGALAQQAAGLVDHEAGWPHFSLLVTTVTSIDWLQITKTGSQHAEFAWKEGAWAGQWLA